MLYPIIRNTLFVLPPETAHTISMKGLHLAAAMPFGKQLLAGSFQYKETDLSTSVFGLQFSNPVGLGAGFDKNAEVYNSLFVLYKYCGMSRNDLVMWVTSKIDFNKAWDKDMYGIVSCRLNK